MEAVETKKYGEEGDEDIHHNVVIIDGLGRKDHAVEIASLNWKKQKPRNMKLYIQPSLMRCHERRIFRDMGALVTSHLQIRFSQSHVQCQPYEICSLLTSALGVQPWGCCYCRLFCTVVIISLDKFINEKQF